MPHVLTVWGRGEEECLLFLPTMSLCIFLYLNEEMLSPIGRKNNQYPLNVYNFLLYFYISLLERRGEEGENEEEGQEEEEGKETNHTMEGNKDSGRTMKRKKKRNHPQHIPNSGEW